MQLEKLYELIGKLYVQLHNLNEKLVEEQLENEKLKQKAAALEKAYNDRSLSVTPAQKKITPLPKEIKNQKNEEGNKSV